MPNTSKSVIYLDYAAATPLDPRVLAAMGPYLSERFYNPSANYMAARRVRDDLETARRRVALVVGARASEIIFTAGGTEANNLAIHGVMRQYPQANIVVSAIEHESVLAPAQRYDCRQITVKADGRVNVNDLCQKIDDQTVLVSVMYANNEIGTIQPLKDIASIIAEHRKARTSQGQKTKSQILPLYFHADACQAANHLDLHVARLGVDMMTLNGGKIYGPKQSGALYLRAVPFKNYFPVLKPPLSSQKLTKSRNRADHTNQYADAILKVPAPEIIDSKSRRVISEGYNWRLWPLIDGGGQERGLRSGTENVAACIGFATALEGVQSDRQGEIRRLQALREQFIDDIAQRLPQAFVNGSRKQRLPGNVHLTIPGADNERLLIQLEEAGILAAAGSACSGSSDQPSHVLAAIGLSEAEARASLRFSLGRQTTSDQLSLTARCLARIVAA